MRNLLASLVLAGLVVASPVVAHAEITTRVILILGTALTPDQAKRAHDKQAELARQGLALFVDPSKLDDLDPKPTLTVYVGTTLSSQTIGHNTAAATTHAPPTADAIARLENQLAADGLPHDVQLIALVAYSGGK